MDFRYLYLGTEGRISRKTFWTGAIVLALIGFLVMLVVTVPLLFLGQGFIRDFRTMSQVIMWLNLASAAVYAYPAYCLAVKRRHDRNSSGWDVLGYLGVNGALLVALLILATNGTIGGLGFSPAMSWLGYGLQAYGIYMLVVLGFLKGTSGTNSYGPDPLTSGVTATA
ncbi:MAG: DUF805 domain-containing protein [Hyphomicrobiales bacterium]|nr:MAG: DUF805 domain-containing protein [Hyphomicrobiales bacterium]